MGMTWTQWVAQVKQLGGTAATWPFNDGHLGEPAANWLSADYANLYNQGLLPSSGTRAANNNQSVFVLASAMTGDNTVVTTAPATMTTAQQIENAAFNAGDTVANSLGLPSLASIEGTLSYGKYALYVGAALLALKVLSEFSGPLHTTERTR